MEMSMEESKGPKTRDKLFEGDEWHLPTDVSLIGRAVNEFGNRARVAEWSNAEIASLELAVIEALANAMKHGNSEDPEKQVYVKLEINKETITVTIRDEGKGFDPEAVPDPTQSENLLKTTGRGIKFFMKPACDEVTFEIIKNEDNEVIGTEVKMIKTRNKSI